MAKAFRYRNKVTGGVFLVAEGSAAHERITKHDANDYELVDAPKRGRRGKAEPEVAEEVVAEAVTDTAQPDA